MYGNVWFGIDIEPLFVFLVAAGFYFFEGRTYFSLHFIEQCDTEGIAEKGVIKVVDIAPKPVNAVAAPGNKAADMTVTPRVMAAQGDILAVV